MFQRVLPSNNPNDNTPKQSIVQEPHLPFGEATAIPNDCVVQETGVIELTPQESQYRYWELYEIRFANERYRKYREGQDGKKSARQEDVWPADVEEVFWEAITKYKPLPGRKKRKWKYHDPKIYGRNEIIAMYMESQLGSSFFDHMLHNPKSKELKTPRKVVSSHLQVLKGKFKESAGARTRNWIVMQWLGGKDKSNKKRGLRNRAAAKSHRSEAPRRNPLQPSEFDMYLGTEQGAVSYRFSMSDASHYQQSDLRYQPWQLAKQYPILARMRKQGRLSCNVILAESSIAWTRERPSTEKTTLNIINLFQVPPGSTLVPQKCHAVVTYFDAGVETRVIGRHDISSETRSDGSQNVVLELKTGSEYWVNLFQKLWKKMSKTKLDVERNHLPLQALEDAAEACEKEIENVTALIEIYGECIGVANDVDEDDDDEDRDSDMDTDDRPTKNRTTRQSGRTSQDPLMVVHWSFKTAAPGCVGRTTWRNLIAPEAQTTTGEDTNTDPAMNPYPAIAGNVPPFAMLPEGLQYRDTATNNANWTTAAEWHNDMSGAAATSGMEYPWHSYESQQQVMSGRHSPLRLGHLGNSHEQTMPSIFHMPVDPAISAQGPLPALDPAIMAGVAESLGQAQHLNHPGTSLALDYQIPGMPHSSQPGAQLNPQSHYVPWSSSDASRALYRSGGGVQVTDDDDQGGVALATQHSAMYAPCVPSMRTTQGGGGFGSSHAFQRSMNTEHRATQSQRQSNSFQEIPTSTSAGSASLQCDAPCNGNGEMHMPQQPSAGTAYGFESQDSFYSTDITPKQYRHQPALLPVNGNDTGRITEIESPVGHGNTSAGSHQALHERRGQFHMIPVHTEYAPAPSHPQITSRSNEYSPYYADTRTSQSSCGTGGTGVILTPQSAEEHPAVSQEQTVCGTQQAEDPPPDVQQQTTQSYESLSDMSSHYSRPQRSADYYHAPPQPVSQQYGQCVSRGPTSEEDWVRVEDESSTPRRNDEGLGLVFDPSILEGVGEVDMRDRHDVHPPDDGQCVQGARPQLLPSALEI